MNLDLNLSCWLVIWTIGIGYATKNIDHFSSGFLLICECLCHFMKCCLIIRMSLLLRMKLLIQSLYFQAITIILILTPIPVQKSKHQILFSYFSDTPVDYFIQTDDMQSLRFCYHFFRVTELVGGSKFNRLEFGHTLHIPCAYSSVSSAFQLGFFCL